MWSQILTLTIFNISFGIRQEILIRQLQNSLPVTFHTNHHKMVIKEIHIT